MSSSQTTGHAGSQKVICVEDHAQDWVESEMVLYLRAFGYALKDRAACSSIFVLDKFVSKAPTDTRSCVPLAQD